MKASQYGPLPRRRCVPVRGSGLSANVVAQRAALARMDACERLCGRSEAELDAMHAAMRRRVRARVGGAA